MIFLEVRRWFWSDWSEQMIGRSGSMPGNIGKPSVLAAQFDIMLPDPDTRHAAHMFMQKAASRYNMAGAILFGSRALPIWEDEWAHPDHYSNPHLLANIAKEGIRL
ncbi:MAG: hypothetical protein Q8O34_14890 [Rhodocyclaceae bacterium]|nr:hypothetical protein [Rhodocyclaceae bacterium]